MFYLSVKSIHILAVISWMAGLLYLPRLFVYHCDTMVGSQPDELFKVMERRLLKAIMAPAMMVAWGSGLYLAVESGFHRAIWFQIKFLLVIGMTAVHIYLRRFQLSFAAGQRSREARFFRILNEVPTVLMIGIVLLVVFRPF